MTVIETILQVVVIFFSEIALKNFRFINFELFLKFGLLRSNYFLPFEKENSGSTEQKMNRPQKA